MYKYPIVSVSWKDSGIINDWVTIEDILDNPIPICHTVGHLIGESEETLILASTIESKDARHLMFIIKANIISRQILRVRGKPLV